jgi:mRNA interferase MazF
MTQLPIELRLRPKVSSIPRKTHSAGKAKGGRSSVRRGEIRWYTYRAPDKRRPVLLLTRDVVIESVNEIVVAPVTRTVRGISTEVLLTADDGMPVVCAVNLDHVSVAQKSLLGAVVSVLRAERWPEVARTVGRVRIPGVTDRRRFPSA